MNSFSYKMLLVPQPPQYRNILIEERTKTVPLHFPHSMFFIFYLEEEGGEKLQFVDLQLAFSKTPLTGNKKEKLYGLPLHNTEAGFNVCMGDDLDDETYSSIEELAKRVISAYWSTPFDDLTGEFDEYDPSYEYWTFRYKELAPTFYKRWTEAGRNNNPKFIQRVRKLLDSPHVPTIGKLIDSYASTISEYTVLNLRDNSNGRS